MDNKVFEYKKPLSFPRIVSVYDTASSYLEKVRKRVSFRNVIRFVEDPMVLIKYPIQPNQIVIMIMRLEYKELWDAIDKKVPENCAGIIIIDDELIKRYGMPDWKLSSNKLPVSILQRAMEHDPLKYFPGERYEGVHWARRMAYLVGATHFISPAPLSKSEKQQNIIDIDEKNDDEINECIPETIWVTNIVKQKNFDERRVVLANMNKMIHLPPETRNIDRIILFGNTEFINPERFRYVEGDEGCIPCIFKNNNHPHGLFSVYDMISYVDENTPKNSVIFFMRQEATEMEYTMLRSANRLSPRTFAVLNPFVMPDVPDPKPEIFQRGDMRGVGGYIIRKNNDNIGTTERMKKMTLYNENHSAVITGEMMKLRFRIGNGTRQIAVGFPNVKTLLLIEKVEESPTDILCPEVQCIGLYASDTIQNIPNIQKSIMMKDIKYDEGSVKISGEIFRNKTPLEIKTLLNMTNKTLQRANKENLLFTETDREINTKNPIIRILKSDNYRIRRDFWTYQQICQTHWGEGTSQRESGFIHVSTQLNKTNIIPFISGEGEQQVLSFINQMCIASYLINTPELIKHRHITFENPNEIKSLYDKYLPTFFGLSSTESPVNCDTIDSSVKNVFCGEETQIISYCSDMKQFGYVPQIVKSVCKNMIKKRNVDLNIMEKLGETHGLIVGSQWASLLLTKCKEAVPTIEWKIVDELKNGTANDYIYAKYIVGTRNTDAWGGCVLADPEYCSCIEITPEHDTNPMWYYLANTVGMKIQILPLKQEPAIRCEKRIRDNLNKYFI
jgi:hypothetical protein